MALGQREKIMMFGDDYNTPDGTCIRDYIHVEDLVAAHFLGLKDLQNGGESDFYNLGNGNGFSVKEIVDAVREVTNHEIPAEVAPRRARSSTFSCFFSESEREVRMGSSVCKCEDNH